MSFDDLLREGYKNRDVKNLKFLASIWNQGELQISSKAGCGQELDEKSKQGGSGEEQKREPPLTKGIPGK